MPSSRLTLRGAASFREMVRRSGPAERNLVVRASPDLEEVDDGAVGVDDAHAVLDRRRDVVPPVAVEQKPSRATTSFSITPLGLPSCGARWRPRALDDDEGGLAIDGDAVSVHEARRQRHARFLALEREDPSIRLGGG